MDKIRKFELINWEGGVIPKTTYKYRDWSNPYHQKSLLNSEIFFASPSSFNDPFDCKVPIDYLELSKNEESAVRFARQLFQETMPDLSNEKLDIEINKFLKDGRFKDPEYIKKVNADFFKDLGNEMGICCLTPIRDNILMWSHYANSHKGICIGYNSVELFTKSQGSGGRVVYYDELPEISPNLPMLKRMNRVTHSKSSIWKYEEEYRVVKMNNPNWTLALSPYDISEVIFGCNMAESEIIDIMNKCTSEKYPNLKFYRAKQAHNSFLLDVVPV